MFQFPAFASFPYVFEEKIPSQKITVNPKPDDEATRLRNYGNQRVGCPIRKSPDQSLFAAPQGLSQRITSFIACACQGIHQMPLRHLIVHIADGHLAMGIASFLLAPTRSRRKMPGKTSFTRPGGSCAVRRHEHLAAGWRPSAACRSHGIPTDLLFTMILEQARAKGPGKLCFPTENVLSSTPLAQRQSRPGREAGAMMAHRRRWWSQTGSNRRPPECKSGALPAELWPLVRQRRTPRARQCRCRTGPQKIWWAWIDSN